MPEGTDSHQRREKRAEFLLVLVAAALATVVARPYAGSWNDGSRLASVESLVDQHTWVIDHSIFVQVPQVATTTTPLPYPPRDKALIERGTQDKLWINGHFYSDKSPVPALLMAGCYRIWQWTTGMTARTHPDRFCWAMTFASSGAAYVLAIGCVYRLGRRGRLPLSSRLLLTTSFALATVALPYARQVNNHILLLAVVAALALKVAGLREWVQTNRTSWRQIATMGFLAGLGYTIDLGAGPVILLCTLGLIVFRSFSRDPQGSAEEFQIDDCGLMIAKPGFQSSFINLKSSIPRVAAKRIALFALAALPCMVLHHVLNYAIGGTLKPANANPEYFRWPGSPFAAANLTGSWIHPNFGSFLLYAASMIGGKRGFLGHNVPLFLTIPALWVLWRQFRQIRVEVLWAVGCCVGTWLLYAATSNNSSGQCCTIRWFVPLLAPAYLLLTLLLQASPRSRLDLLLLSCWGTLMVYLMREGPWLGGMVRFFWPIQAAALGSWASYRYLRRPDLEILRQHPYTNSCGNSSPSGAAACLLWKTIPSLSGARANTISATSTSTCPEINSSSSPA